MSHQLKTKLQKSTADHFIVKEGIEYSGTHLLIDLWQASHLNNEARIKNTLIQCIERCQAKLLHIHTHQFTDTGGISGVAILAESHISVHTWPERHYAALDVFMCGNSDPYQAIDVLKAAFETENVTIKEILRGHHEL